MVRKGASRLAWSQPALQAFDDLRQRFTTAPILHHPDPDRPFIVEVDASSTGVGAVLSQQHSEPAKMFPCAYFSHKLSPAERNYDVGNRELLAIKLALEEWRHWLEGAKHSFTVLTDHRNLEYLRSAKVLNHRQARWSLFFTRFQFQVSYRPGTQNTKADALSRIHEPGQPVASSESVLPTTLILAPGPQPGPYSAQLGTPRHRGHLAPPSQSFLVANPPPRHHQVRAELQYHQNTAAPARRTTPASAAIDFVTDLPPSNGYTTILSVVDRFSKGCRFIPLPKLPTAMETAEHLCNWVFRLYGLPENILSDRGPQFISRLWASFFGLLGVNVSLTSGYHPQANGQVERLNQELTRFLRSYCLDHQEDWSRYLFWAEYAQNSLRKPATNLTPFQCTLGFQPPLFPWSGEPSDLPAVNSWFQRSEETWDRAHVHLQGAIRRYQEQANRSRRPNPAYEPGQWVWLSTRDLRLRLPCKKLSPRYVGPFKIIKQITPVSYRLELPAEYRISPTFHVSLFKPADDPAGVENLEGTASQGPAPIVIDGEEVYRVNTILDSRRRRGQLQYLVDWEGFGPEERSWVASRDILDPSLTTDFHTQHPDRPAPPRKGQTPASGPSSRQESLAGGGLCFHGVAVSGSYPRTTKYIPLQPVPGTRPSVSGSFGALPSGGHLWTRFAGISPRSSELSQPLSDSVIIKSSLVFKEHGAQALLVSDCIGASCIDCIDPPSFQRAELAGTLRSSEAPDDRDEEICLPLPSPSLCFYSESH
ncbi:Transposon Tf2-8 polyprotein [Labeo rohita]|uniref:Transposon Tf2-8 polyprotein n=1 Tax=Labeo rohita TaxID=84645 RepID=A0ABQ8LIY9_LABRO|nr:Transposon Tf2-8 polyprotein [Labeo rohita]